MTDQVNCNCTRYTHLCYVTLFSMVTILTYNITGNIHNNLLQYHIFILLYKLQTN